MDSTRSTSNENYTILTECVSEHMTACEAANATKECWTEAETALAPVIGLEGVGVLLRKGEEAAVRNAGFESASVAGTSIGEFCDWVGTLAKSEAVAACKAFLASVERYLVSLVGAHRARRLPARRKER